jgi:hypothetical protein
VRRKLERALGGNRRRRLFLRGGLRVRVERAGPERERGGDNYRDDWNRSH